MQQLILEKFEIEKEVQMIEATNSVSPQHPNECNNHAKRLEKLKKVK